MSDEKKSIWPMTDVQIAAIRERCDKATPPPWVASEYANCVDLGYKPDHERTWGYGCGNSFVCDLNDGEYHNYCNESEQRANAEFIAHAREDVPALLAEVERLRADVARSRTREEWLARHLAYHDDASVFEPFCPMPMHSKCEWQDMDFCRAKLGKRAECWRKLAEIETRENPGNSEEVPENPGEGK